jgi:hypothetical protein
MTNLHEIKGLLAPVTILAAAFAQHLNPAPTAAASPKAVPVEVRQMQGGYQLLRAGKPYFIKGAGGNQYPERIAAYGGNSIRTWDTREAAQVLKEANQQHLTVMLGLDVARERHGFDYNNAAAVAKQLETLRAEVLKYKDDPALLVWGIGNELNLDYTNPNVWNAVNDIARMIHEVDPNHPTTTVLAGMKAPEVAYIKARCPALDLLAVNTYADLMTMPQEISKAGWTGPYLVGEWGPTGHWECPQTPWKASVEETSSQKAEVYRARYEASVPKDAAHCLGSYVFLWGQKQERTPTWYGLFTEDGQESEVLDVMQYLWSGKWPANRAPHLSSFLLDGKKGTDNIYLRPGATCAALAQVTDPDRDRLTYRWELLAEPTELSQGGDHENRPAPIAGRLAGTGGQATLTAPDKPGAYRLFVYATDGHNNVATANAPFYVSQ